MVNLCHLNRFKGCHLFSVHNNTFEKATSYVDIPQSVWIILTRDLEQLAQLSIAVLYFLHNIFFVQIDKEELSLLLALTGSSAPLTLLVVYGCTALIH